MTDLRAAAQQALEAWEHINKYGFVLADYEGPMEQAITALKAALEQPIDYFAVQRIANERGLDYNRFAAALRDYAALEQPEQEQPVTNNPDPYSVPSVSLD
jgi:hypothetical protein